MFSILIVKSVHNVACVLLSVNFLVTCNKWEIYIIFVLVITQTRKKLLCILYVTERSILIN